MRFRVMVMCDLFSGLKSIKLLCMNRHKYRFLFFLEHLLIFHIATKTSSPGIQVLVRAFGRIFASSVLLVTCVTHALLEYYNHKRRGYLSIVFLIKVSAFRIPWFTFVVFLNSFF